MTRQPNTELPLLSASFLAAVLGGRAYVLVDSELNLHPGPDGQRH